jgi:hypothetical protein
VHALEAEPLKEEQDDSHGAVKPAPATSALFLINSRRDTEVFLVLKFGIFSNDFK